jgi:hypothetical protein
VEEIQPAMSVRTTGMIATVWALAVCIPDYPVIDRPPITLYDTVAWAGGVRGVTSDPRDRLHIETRAMAGRGVP